MLPLGAVHHLATAPALEGVLLHAGLSLLGVKALIDAVVMDDLRFEVFRPEVDVLILEVLLLGIQTSTTKCSGKHWADGNAWLFKNLFSAAPTVEPRYGRCYLNLIAAFVRTGSFRCFIYLLNFHAF